MKMPLERTDQTIVACQNYWSFLPLSTELEKYGPRFGMVRDDCAGVYRRLDQGEVHFAFCSTISLARNADFEMALPVGVVHESSNGLAYWGLIHSLPGFKDYVGERIQALRDIFRWAQLSRTDNLKQALQAAIDEVQNLPRPRLESVPLIRFNNGYTSWSVLSRLMYKLLFGSEAFETMLRLGSSNVPGEGQEFQMELKVENEALQRRCSYRSVIDLADLWRSMTGMPFVSSILQKTRRCQAQNCRSSLAGITELAEMRMQVEPCNYLPDMLPCNTQQQTIDLCGVWRSLSYRLTAEDLRSLLVFLYLAKPLEKKGLEDEAFTLKMLRWQQREAGLPSLMA
ncbi:MAG: hypothetical protein ACOVS5_12965 [Oligoflexus sp.]|jgi:predicted solute-binding protein